MKHPNPSAHALPDWNAIMPHIAAQIGAQPCHNWFAQVQPVSEESNAHELVLACPSRFIKDWVQSRYSSHVLQAARAAGHSAQFVRFVVHAAAGQNTASLTYTNAAERQDNPASEANSATKVRAFNRKRQKHYDMAQFVVGASNRLAHSAITNLIEQEGHLIGANPLILHGGVGLGKTHLLQAAAQELSRDPSLNVTYLSAEQFMYEFVSALQKKDMASFKQQFRSGDVLLMDDIQFLCGKQSTQEEFQHTINALMDAGAQLVLSCNAAPQHLDGIDERVRSRLTAGLVIEIQAPDAQLIEEVARQKAAQLGVPLSEEVLHSISRTITRNVREVEGAIHRLYAHHHMLGETITPDAATDILRHFAANSTAHVTLARIKEATSEHTDISIADMESARRQRPVVQARQLAMYLCKQRTSESYPSIARAFGNRDHATVMHAVKTMEAALQKDTDLHALAQKIKASL